MSSIKRGVHSLVSSLLGIKRFYSHIYISELRNVFDVFIPQLLRYPNPSDPLNGEAASLLMENVEKYNKKVQGTLICLDINIVE